MQPVTKSLLFNDSAYLESGGTRRMFLTEEYHSKDLKDFSLLRPFCNISQQINKKYTSAWICQSFKDRGNCQDPQLHSKSGIRNVLGQKQENALLSLQTPVPYSTCITLQAHRPRTCLQNWCCLCTPECCRVWALPCNHQDENTEYTASFRLPFPIRKCSQLYCIYTQRVGFTLCINIICPIQWGSVAHPCPAPCSQKHTAPIWTGM